MTPTVIKLVGFEHIAIWNLGAHKTEIASEERAKQARSAE
jgi:hypothetical protein